MKISAEVREYADSLGTDIDTAKQKGMDEMSETFQKMGSEVYIDASKINNTKD
jgi:phosphomethylpyrimidine synthase